VKSLLHLALGLTLALSAPRVRAEAGDNARVSFLDGKANATSSGKKAALQKGAVVRVGDVVETDPGAKLELEMTDGSVLRIGPASRLELKAAHFGAAGEKTFSAKLLFGRVWSKVSGLVGRESKFEVETDNAVAGVRGTTFRIDARADKSLLVRVYAGSVAMAPGGVLALKKGPEKGKRVQVAGPSQVSLKEWEKIVGKMMQLAINADGSPATAEATPFTAEDDKGDEWAAWNQAMDDKH